MPEGVRIFLMVISIIIAFGGITAFALFMFIFPFINKRFGKKLPAYDYTETFLDGEKEFFDELFVLSDIFIFQKGKKDGLKKQSEKNEKQDGEQNKAVEKQAKAEVPGEADGADGGGKQNKEEEAKGAAVTAEMEVSAAAEPIKAEEKPKTPARRKTVDYHKDVPTVILPPLKKNAKDKDLTEARIEAAAKRRVKKQDSAENAKESK